MMNFNMTLSQQAEYAMPISGSGVVAAVRALPNTVVWGALPAAAAAKIRFADSTTVCGYSRNADVAVVTGVVPGTSAWSPPI